VSSDDDGDKLWALAKRSPVLGPILERWREIALPDCWLVAGAVAQTVWNGSFKLPPTHGLADVDLVSRMVSAICWARLCGRKEAGHAGGI
jgi:hypothetical protein